MKSRFKRPLLVILITLSLTLLVGVLAFLSATWGVDNGQYRPLGTAQLPIITRDDLTLMPFALVDATLLDILQNAPSAYQQNALQVDDLPAIGAYLPRTGDTRFDNILPTPTPTPLPFPTSPPLPLPPIVGDTLPPSFTDDIARTLPYGGDACAPAGMPASGILTQRFHAYHGGIDIGVPLGTPVIATHSGTVTFAGWSEVGYGYLVIIQNGEFITYYAHNTSFNVTPNQQIGKGSIIAWSGSTGNSTGPHIHYETRVNDIPLDPLTFEARGYPSC